MNTRLKTLLKGTAISALITSVAGTLLHFLYEWANKNVIVGLFSATNESVWEHLKLLFIPLLFTTVIENIIYGKHYGNFFFSRLVGALVGLFTIVSVHYTYTGVIGKRFDFVDVILFFVAVIIAYGVSFFLAAIHEKRRFDNLLEISSLLSLAVIAAIFFIFSYSPPNLPIFIPAS